MENIAKTRIIERGVLVLQLLEPTPPDIDQDALYLATKLEPQPWSPTPWMQRSGGKDSGTQWDQINGTGLLVRPVPKGRKKERERERETGGCAWSAGGGVCPLLIPGAKQSKDRRQLLPTALPKERHLAPCPLYLP